MYWKRTPIYVRKYVAFFHFTCQNVIETVFPNQASFFDNPTKKQQ